MMELIIHGRGGQGGVTLAKLIATAYFLRGKHAQAFGVYAAERSGAPLQAFVRVDDQEIVNYNQIARPDHVIVLDRTLLETGNWKLENGRKQASTSDPKLSDPGWVIINSPELPASRRRPFAGWRLARVDATEIAVANGLGTRAVPIVNTTMLGAVSRALGLSLDDMQAALIHLKFDGPNTTAARQAYEAVELGDVEAEPEAAPDGPRPPPGRRSPAAAHVAGLLDPDIGRPPLTRTGSWATRQPHRRRFTPPCNHGCPAGNDVQAFLQHAARGDSDAALAVLLDTSPFPGVCGRVCPAPCMQQCNRAEYDEAVNVRDLERHVADHGHAPPPVQPWRGEKVAIIGSGPAGLSAAYHLARLGYPVTLFEAGDELGGLMRTGIPAYRLPRNVLDLEISYILRHGVSVKRNEHVDRARLLELTHQFAAVFVGTGLQQMQALDLGWTDDGMVEQGIRFLDRVRRGGELLTGKRIVVVGGGNTAIDAARSARRLGARVEVLYRRTREQMPAIREEIEEAVEEGVRLTELASPVHLRTQGPGAVLTCVRMRLGEPDASGRPRPVPETSEDGFFDLSCHRVILALGQNADLSILPEGSDVTRDGRLHGLSGAPVFFGGDFATNDGTVTAAIGNGRRAAQHIHQTLSGEELVVSREPPVAGLDVVRVHTLGHRPREEALALPPSLRRGSFAEVRMGLLDEPGHSSAELEAQRCFSCGVCNQCDTCMEYCPEGILRREGDEYRFDYDYCKGCGICAAVCPRGVVYMEQL